jgi:LPXTG-motif cell wall-anchored protein
VSLKTGLANGTYTVNWKNSSTDGHSEAGDFSFVIGTASASTPGTLPATGGDVFTSVVLLLIGLLLLGGAWMVRRAA